MTLVIDLEVWAGRGDQWGVKDKQRAVCWRTCTSPWLQAGGPNKECSTTAALREQWKLGSPGPPAQLVLCWAAPAEHAETLILLAARCWFCPGCKIRSRCMDDMAVSKSTPRTVLQASQPQQQTQTGQSYRRCSAAARTATRGSQEPTSVRAAPAALRAPSPAQRITHRPARLRRDLANTTGSAGRRLPVFRPGRRLSRCRFFLFVGLVVKCNIIILII